MAVGDREVVLPDGILKTLEAINVNLISLVPSFNNFASTLFVSLKFDSELISCKVNY